MHMKQVKILESKRRGSCNFRKMTVHLKTPERHLAVCSTRLAEPRAEDSGPGSLLLGPERQQEPGRKNQRGSGRGNHPPQDRPARGAPRTRGGPQGAAAGGAPGGVTHGVGRRGRGVSLPFWRTWASSEQKVFSHMCIL